MMAIGVIASLVGIDQPADRLVPCRRAAAARDIDTLYDVLLICSVRSSSS